MLTSPQGSSNYARLIEYPWAGGYFKLNFSLNGVHLLSGAKREHYRSGALTTIYNAVDTVVSDEQRSDFLGSASTLLVPIRWDEPFVFVDIAALARYGLRGSMPEIGRDGPDGYLAADNDEMVYIRRLMRYRAAMRPG